jgi:hypothetical protein
MDKQGVFTGETHLGRPEPWKNSLYFSLITGIHQETGSQTDCIHRHYLVSGYPRKSELGNKPPENTGVFVLYRPKRLRGSHLARE